ncbi:cytochrome C oxidase [Novimethylophilus kurashikiensis]|uniref:Cytochrome C oxidase n=1 Tax=Novimethylophilus kurashikiensis TaxID=1825523 RepID=A0A2R5F4P2_9PROT|nr:4Fe-4S binding protein [Novimethylophilus kurashikiensis]GBG13362.1 cytochrome C oxidase [Novimethylophilus kurashikiensis]
MQRLIQPLTPFHTPDPTRLAWLGELLRRHRTTIIALQWIVVLAYIGLVTVPALLPLPPADGRMLHNLTLFAQFVFWGIWWPFVILSMMLMGRVWCGVLCPEGALSEFASKFGLGKPIPRWMKWGGWPFVAFILTTVYGQLVSVYEYAVAALLVLGGSTLAAIGIGLVYGKNKRVWCRHLCPVNGVFGLLSRLAPVHFRVDQETWKASTTPPQAIHCAPMVHIKSMKGASDCHMCGQCAGHKGAIALTLRNPGSEVVDMHTNEAKPWEAALLVFGMIGTAIGAFQWSGSPWFVAAKQAAAEWLVAKEWWWALDTNAPWWLLTHYPEASDTFTWLDGAMILTYIAATAIIVGSWVWAWLKVAAVILGGKPHVTPSRLAYSLIPMGGFGVFLGLSALTVTMLKAEGLMFPWLGTARALVLAFAAAWSLHLAYGVISRQNRTLAARYCSLAAVAMAIGGIIVPWVLLFYIW